MSELGDVLELLQTSSSRWHTLRAAGYRWVNDALASEAFKRGHESGSWREVGPGMVGVFGNLQITSAESDEGDDAAGDDDPETWQLWIDQPEHRRVEFIVGQETVTAVWVGDTWSSWRPGSEIETNAGDTNYRHGKGPFDIDRCILFGSLYEHLRVHRHFDHLLNDSLRRRLHTGQSVQIGHGDVTEDVWKGAALMVRDEDFRRRVSLARRVSS